MVKRSDEIASILKYKGPMQLEQIATMLSELHPEEPYKRLFNSARGTLFQNAGRFEQASDGTFQIRQVSVSYGDGQWSSKTEFILAHLHRTPQETIALGATYGINLTASTVYTVRSTAKKQETEEPTEEIVVESPQPPVVRAVTQTTQTTTTLVTHEPAVRSDSLDAMISALLDKEMVTTRLQEQVSLIVRERVDVLAKQKIEAMITATAQEEIQAFFANL